MKANAPEKIYFNRESIESILDDDPLFNCLSIKENDDDIEYTRTDAFIEKALTFIRSCTTYDGLGYKAKCVDIEKFKNYMKGEECMAGIVKCPKCGTYMLVSKMIEESGKHKGMHSAYCLSCNYTKYVR